MTLNDRSPLKVVEAPAPNVAAASAGRLVAVVVTHNRLDKLKDTLARLLESPAAELAALVVVDNASTDGTGAWLAGLTDPRLDVVSSARTRLREIAASRASAHASFSWKRENALVPRPAKNLKLEECIEVARRFAAGESAKELAAAFGISPRHVNRLAKEEAGEGIAVRDPS